MDRGDRGFTLVEIMVAAAICIAVTTAIVMIGRGMARAATANALHQHNTVALGQFMARLENDSNDAAAVFVPAADVMGLSNADGHEIDFMTRDVNRVAKFWAYDYYPRAQLVQEYTYATPGSGAVVQGSGITGIAGFSAQSFKASTLSSPMFTAPPKDHDFAMGWPGVIGGNMITRVQAGANAERRSVDLMAGLLPSGGAIVSGTWTPPPSTTLAVSVLGAYADPNAAAQTLTAQDDPAYIGQLLQSNSCANIATVSPSSTVRVPATNRGAYGYTVTPVASLTSSQSCDITIADQFGNAATAPVRVNVPPAGCSAPSPCKLTFSRNGTQSATLTQSLFTGNFTLTGNSCGGAVSAPSSVADSGGTASVSVTALSPNANCTLTYTGGWGQQASIGVDVMGPLSVTGPGSGGSGTSNGSGATTNLLFYKPGNALTVSATKSGAGALALSYPSNGCGGAATVSGVTDHGGGNATFVVTGNAATSGCSFQVADQYGDTDTVDLAVWGALVCNGASSCTLNFTSPTAPAQSVTLSKQFMGPTLTVTPAAPSCGGDVSTSTSVGTGANTVTVTPHVATSNCTIAVADGYGETMVLTVNVNPPSPPTTPTPPAGADCATQGGAIAAYFGFPAGPWAADYTPGDGGPATIAPGIVLQSWVTSTRSFSGPDPGREQTTYISQSGSINCTGSSNWDPTTGSGAFDGK